MRSALHGTHHDVSHAAALASLRFVDCTNVLLAHPRARDALGATADQVLFVIRNSNILFIFDYVMSFEFGIS